MLTELRKSAVVQLIFVISISVSCVVIYFIEEYRYQQKISSVEKLTSSYVSLISHSVSQALSATYPLAAMVRKQNGDVTGFTELATEMLPYYPGAASLQLAPDGIVKYIVPFSGNEAALGHNLLADPERNNEAFLAKETNQLTLAGPFKLVQGGIAAVGRLPIYLKQLDGKDTFWGFSTVLIRFPEVLESAKLHTLVEAGIAYELSRVHPDTNEIQVISNSKEPLIDHPEAYAIDVPNGKWTLKVTPIKSWRNYKSLILEILSGLAFSLLLTFSAVLIRRLKENQESLEETVTDRTRKLNDNLRRLELALKTAKQGWFESNLQTGEIIVSNEYPKLLGYDPSEFHSSIQEWPDNLHPDERETVLRKFQESLTSNGSSEMEYRRKGKNGQWVWLHTVGEVVERDEQNKPIKGIGIHTDISERKRIEHRDNIRSSVLEQLVKGDPLKTILDSLIKAVEQESQFILCSILLLDKDGKHLNIGAASSLPDFYNEAVDGIEIGEGVGSCGTAAFTRERVIVEDIQTHPYWAPYRELAAKANLGSSWSEPIIGSNDRLLGTFAIYHHEPCVPDEEDFKLIEFAAHLAAIAIDRNESDEKQHQSSRVFEDAHEGITITDAEGMIIDINPSFCKITGYSREEVIGKNSRLLGSGKHDAEFFKKMWQALAEHEHWQGEIWNRKKNGELYEEMLTISSLKDETGNVRNYVGLFIDITQSKEQQRALELMAHYDVLTHLPNRALFTDRFEQAVAHSKRLESSLAICFLDLDNFKPVNDNYGHDVGDQLLIDVAQRIKANIREEDTVSRQGGDEFVLLLGDVASREQGEQMMERIHHAIAEPYLINGHTIDISASSGITFYPLDNADLDSLLRHADQAMYQAKMSGKNRYHLFNAEEDQKIVIRHHRLQEIEDALLQNQFCLYYQPKVNMKSGEVFGVEALIRWQHPDKGIILPMDFLPLTDGTDLEIQIGNWVINEALNKLGEWKSQGLEFEVSVNIAPHQLRSPSFIKDLDAALAKHPDIDSRYLQLEILESSALRDLNYISTIVKTCRNTLGVQIALDDFGTGYSSLTSLRNLSINMLKIDKSFVRDVLIDPSDYAIIDGVIGLANAFERKVIAEGVEATEHGCMLLLMGCELAQGYAIARPMPASDILLWYKNYTPVQAWIDCANDDCSPEERNVKLLKLVIKQWRIDFEKSIRTSRDSINHWPIMASTKCHCGKWIMRSRHARLFGEDWLDSIDKVHQSMHYLANDLRNQHQADDADAVKDGLTALREIYATIDETLGSCEYP